MNSHNVSAPGNSQSLANLPPDARLISLRYASRCRSCSTSLAVGERAHWSKSSKAVWCLDCVKGERKPQHTSSSHSKSDASTEKTNRHQPNKRRSQPVDETQAPWLKLLTYAQRCVEAEAAKSLVPYTACDESWFPHVGREALVVGESDSVLAPEVLSKRLKSRPRSIIYGWPTVVFIDRDHKPKVAPLFVVPVDPEQDSETRWTLHATMEPEFNLAIIASGLFDTSLAEEVGEFLGDGLPFGDAGAFGALTEQTSRLLGFDVMSPLQAESLVTSFGHKRGVYNAAISVLAEPHSFTASLRQELRKLESCRDWTATAAAHFKSKGLNQ